MNGTTEVAKNLATEFTEKALADGYDGVQLHFGDGTHELVAFSSSQIKSVFNQGGLGFQLQ